MTTSEITDVMYQLFVLAAQLAGPVLIISMMVGIVISIIQAATQIHEQTIGFILKVVVIVSVLLIGGGWMLESLQEYTRELFALIGA